MAFPKVGRNSPELWLLGRRGAGTAGRNQGITGIILAKGSPLAWKLSSDSRVLPLVLGCPPCLCHLYYKEINSATDTHILVKFLSKITVHFNGSTVGLAETTQSSLYSKQLSVLIQFPVAGLWSFLFVWFSDCASFNTHFSADSPPLSILHSSSKPHLLIISIQVQSISLSGQVTKGAEQVSLPCTSHSLIWSFP